MNSRLVRAALGVVIVASACSTALSTEEYVSGISAIADAYVLESQNLSYDYQSSVEDGVREIVDSGVDDAEGDAVELIAAKSVEYLALLGDAMGRYLTLLRELSPPAAINEHHDAYVAAVVVVHDALPDTRDSVAAAGDIGAIQLALTSSGFADGQIRWTTSCTSLEEAIRAEGLGVDLGCVRPETTP